MNEILNTAPDLDTGQPVLKLFSVITYVEDGMRKDITERHTWIENKVS